MLTDEQVRQEFGDPTPLLRDDGSVSTAWEQSILVVLPLPAPLPVAGGYGVARYVRCHHRIRDRLRAALEAVFNQPDAWASVNDYAGCYCWRLMRGAHKLSRHSWGIAIDLDSRDNPMGAAPQMHPGVVSAFVGQGFEWGGRWRAPRTDGMHFEFADLARVGSR